MIYGSEYLISIDTILPDANWAFRNDVNHDVLLREYWRESRNAFIQQLVNLADKGLLSHRLIREISQEQIDLYRFWFHIRRDLNDPGDWRKERAQFFSNHLFYLGLIDRNDE